MPIPATDVPKFVALSNINFGAHVDSGLLLQKKTLV